MSGVTSVSRQPEVFTSLLTLSLATASGGERTGISPGGEGVRVCEGVRTLSLPPGTWSWP